jgi:hypothetical protein
MTAAASGQLHRHLRGRPRDFVQTRQGGRRPAMDAGDHGETEADGE